jgi:hypothetical protein
VPGREGPVLLGQRRHAEIDSGPAQIDRYDRLRNINFEIELNQQPLGEVKKPRWRCPACEPAARACRCKPRSATPR